MAIPSYKDIIDLIKKGATVEAQEQIMQLRLTALELQEENIGLKRNVAELQEKLKRNEAMVYEQGVYWLCLESKKDGPFCQRCHDVDGKFVRLYKEQVCIHGNWQQGAFCQQCNAKYAGAF